MSDEAAAVFTFGRLVLDVGRGGLFLDGTERALGPKPMAFLRHLVENHGHVIGRNEIIPIVWPGVIVSDESIDQCVKAIRRALGDDARQMLRTLPKRGFLFTPEVSRRPPHNADPSSPSDASPPGAPLLGAPPFGASSPGGLAASAKPSIAVLPFQNLSGDPEQGYFVDGVVEEIVTALSRIPWLFVARIGGSSRRQQTVDATWTGRELGVRYLLEGSVRRSGRTLRITGQLIDAESGAQLWADRFEGSLRDVFELQDKVASGVAGIIEPTLQAAEIARTAGRANADFAAYDFYLRGHALFLSSALQMAPALHLLEEAIARDPRYGTALALAAMCCQRLVGDSRSDDVARDRRKALDYARRALEAAPDDPGVLVNAAMALAYFGEDIDAMLALVDRALALDPNFARGWHVSGHLRLRAGHLDAAIKHTETSLRLSPRARVGNNAHVTIGAAHFYARRFKPALTNLLLAAQEDPGNPNPYRYLAGCYAHQGQHAEAAAMIARLRGVTNTLVPDVSYLRNPTYRAFFLAGLRMAMGETPP